MKKTSKMLAGVMITAISIILFPINILATDTKTTNLEMVQTDENKYIIYIQDLQKTEFNYAISENKDEKETNLEYIYSTKDEDENQIALVDKSIYDSTKSTKAYLWIKQGEKQIISAQELDFSKAFAKNKIEEVESTSKRINTEIISDLLEEEKTDENGVQITVKVGGIEIKETKDAQYFYQIMPATEDYGTLMTLAEKMKNEYNKTDMYARIKMAKQFYAKYQELLAKTNWNVVDNMQIRQPKEATEETKYVVFIKKVEGNTQTTDVKFLTSQEEHIPSYERERKVVQETTKLPVTGDNLIMVIAFVVIASGMIFVFIRMKNLKKRDK